jgi:serine phosphatase RsbU (regulator of sigma subunit)
MDKYDYPLRKMQLAAGDSICVITDGITEAMNTNGELYGKIRLTRLLERKALLLSPSGMANLLLDDVNNFVGEAEQSDDLTLLIVRWCGRQAT